MVLAGQMRAAGHYVVAVGGQKGGTGKSTVAQAVAVEQARAGSAVMLADLDLGQAASVEWAKRRAAAGLVPAIDARLTSQRKVWELAELCSLLVIDAGRGSDRASILELAQRSDLLVLTSDTNLIELEPTVLLMRELVGHGVHGDKIVIALVKVIDREREKEARAYLGEVGLEALTPSLGWSKAMHDIGLDGRAVSEVANRALATQAAAFVGGIVGQLERVTGRAPRRSVAVAQAARMRQGRERE